MLKLKIRIPSADGYEGYLKMLCSLSELVIFIDSVKIEAVVLSQCPETKRILVACTCDASTGYYGKHTQKH